MAAPKLSKKEQAHVIQMLASFEKDQAVLDSLEKEFGQTINAGGVSYYRVNHKESIEQERDKLRRDHMAIPVANKFYRQAARERLINDIFRRGLWTVDGYVIIDVKLTDEHGNERLEPQRVPKLRGHHAVINQILDSAHREAEPFEVKFVGGDGKAITPQFGLFLNYAREYSAEDKRDLSRLLESHDPDGKGNGEM